MLKILDVASDGIGAELGILPGAFLYAFDGFKVKDIIDYQFYNAQEDFIMTVSGEDGLIDYEISKDAYEDLGLIIEDGLQPAAVCRNKCIFCFVDQLPKGMRKSLYVKDDDWRLSLISGNYVTLTNLTADDRARIGRYRISPLYVSVHATDAAVRSRLLGIKNADIMPMLKELSALGIKFHTQVVMLPGINDGEILAKTIADLKPYALSLAVVPVGLTAYAGPQAVPVTREAARAAIEMCERFAEANRKKEGRGYVYCADEMYLKAELPVKDYAYYDGFPQIENGVGMLAEFEEGLRSALDECAGTAGKSEAAIITGTAARAFMTRMAALINVRFPGLRLNVCEIVNNYFGPSVNAAGLITGGDIAAQAPRGGRLIIPRVMLREFTTVFLDDMSVEELERKLNAKITVADVTGEGLLRAVLEEAGN
ncbi:MAG: DUF512 domain-containing protein [Clostridiales bacterium]|jgi:putative radical SAM enzyme (TIGR03279 family)|nr:DUF512 domain-containing protein [Clostridiales bacterium]